MSHSFLSDQFRPFTQLDDYEDVKSVNGFQYLPDAKHAEGGFYEPMDDYHGDPKPKHAK